MSTPARYMVATPNWRLLLCAFGLHKFYFRCADSHADRDTARECGVCGMWQSRQRSYTERFFAP